MQNVEAALSARFEQLGGQECLGSVVFNKQQVVQVELDHGLYPRGSCAKEAQNSTRFWITAMYRRNSTGLVT